MIVFFPDVGGNASTDHLMFFLDCPIRKKSNMCITKIIK